MYRVAVVCTRAWVIALTLLGFGAAAVEPAPPPPVRGLIVTLKDAAPHEQLTGDAKAQERQTARLHRVLSMARMTEMRFRPVGRASYFIDFGRLLPAAKTDKLVDQIQAQPEVATVERHVRDRLLQAAPPVIPNDPFFLPGPIYPAGQWWLQPVGDPQDGSPPRLAVPGVQGAWSHTAGDAGIVVAVLDTGVTAHSELGGRLLPGYDFVSSADFANDGNGRDDNPEDPGDWVSEEDIADRPEVFGACNQASSTWHGTATTGFIAAASNNAFGVSGINWHSRVLPVRVAGKCGADPLDVVDGMRWAAGLRVPGVPDNPHPARIINVSIGSAAACGSLYQDVINELAERGVVVIAASGNGTATHGADSLSRPANCQGVVSVAALSRNGLKASYSNFGEGVTISTIGGEPVGGGGMLTLNNAGRREPLEESYAHVVGTSFSAPVATGVISLMLSANPALTRAQILEGLRSTARPHLSVDGTEACSATETGACMCSTATCGAGILDAEAAVRYAQDAAPPVVSGGGGGGGALGALWLWGLAAGVLALWRSGPRGAGRKGFAEQGVGA